MSGQITYSREVLQRVSDRKNRKLAIDDSNKMVPDAFDTDLYAPIDSQTEVIEDSQSSIKGHRDLFGVLIPDDKWGNNLSPKTKSNKKTSVTKSKKKSLQDTVSSNSFKKPQQIFIPTPKIVELMKEAQTELYNLMGLNKSSSDLSVSSTGSFNVSGVQLLDNKNEEKSSEVLKGVVAFVDYKIENDQSALDIIELLNMLGAKVENTFNHKVTHVVFHDGYLKTCKTAIKLKIPLVTSKWVENSHLANKMMNPADYSPIDMEKYTKYQEISLISPKCYEHNKFLRHSNINHDIGIQAECDSLMEHVKNLKLNYIKEDSVKVKTPKLRKSIKNLDNIANGFSNNLYDLLNAQDSPYLDEKEISELYIPMSIKTLRKYLTPKDTENKTPSELDDDLIEIENQLKLNSQARQRFRRLLFNSNKDISDFPSPSPLKLRNSAPARLTSKKKQKLLFDKETSHKNKNLKKIEKTPEKQNTQSKVLRWNIPTDLRPKKIKKNIAVKVSETRNNAITSISRDSSMIFQTPKPSINSPVTMGKIACTGFSKNEVNTIKISIQNLGIFTFHTNVEPSTTYLITKSQPSRTLNMVFAMAYGCNIVSENWVHESHKIGRWLPCEHYLISDLSSPVKKFQTRRNTFGSLLTFHIFDEAGSIYVSNTCKPSAKHIKRLVRTCGGKCTSIVTKANIVVGKTSQITNNIQEKWVLDCITQGTLLNKDQYIIVDNNIEL
ncbi:uncharacterized protein LOC112690864 isoform X2 [Sipha flava]|uniref:Microcephalin n=1 Tax=Sipha flava TaxID=143950 RepID=A0A2S2R4L0_9HEMI|nr:uncharacterized protein LOC112690864 isoform X2 [Sipha flava]